MTPLFWILIGSVGVFAVLVVLIMVLRTRVALARQVSQTSIGLWNEVRRALQSMFLLDLRRAMRHGVTALRSAVGKRTFRYERPWYVMLGPTGAGKTALLRTLAEHDSSADSGVLNWGIFRDGVVLDLAGSIALPAGRSAWYSTARRSWRTFCRLLLYYRERRPLDGIIVVVPASELAQFTESQQEQAHILAARLRSLSQRVGMTLPVYIIVTGTDHLEGFAAFVEALPPERRQAILGWNSPYAPDTIFHHAWAEEAIGAVLERLSELQFDLLGRTPTPLTLFTLYDSFAQLIEPASQWLETLVGQRTHSPQLVLRGLYFVGSCSQQSHQPAAVVSAQGASTQPPSNQPSLTVTSLPGTAALCFVCDLFRTKIFREPSIAQPKRRQLIRRSYASIAAHAATAAIVLSMSVFTAGQWKELRQRSETLQRMLEQVRDDRQSYRYEREKLQNPYYYADKTRQYLGYFATLENNRLFSYGMPPSWFGMLHNRLREVLGRSLRDVVMLGMKEEFQRRAQLLTDPNTDYLPTDTLNLGRRSLASTPEYLAFARYVQAVAEFEYHARLYNTLAAPHSDQRLAKIIDYLYQANIEPDVAQLIESDYRLVQRVRLEPVQLEQLRPRFVKNARTMVDACTEKAFLDNAVISSLRSFAQNFRTVLHSTSSEETVTAFAQLFASLERLSAALAHPETEWMSREAFVPDASTTKLLERVATSRLLGGTIRATFQRRIDSLFPIMRLTLATTSVPIRTDMADSTAIVYLHSESKRFQLTPPLEKTRAVFLEWRKQPFAVLDGSRQRLQPFIEQLGSSYHILWNATLLKTVGPTIEAYVKFLNEQVGAFPAELQVPAERALQYGLQRSIEDIVVRAASVQSAPMRIGEDQLSLETQSLVESAPALSIAFRQLSGSSDGSGSQLATILTRQIAQLLGTLSGWLTERSLYSVSITNTRLLQWKPTQSLLSLAFDAETVEDAQAYVARQREPIEQWSKQYAAPLLNLFASAGFGSQASLSVRQANEIRQWSLIVRTLDGYAAKAPNNSLARLEEYILSLGNITMQTPTEAQKAVLQRPPGSQEDYFARKMREIATEIRRGIVLNADSRFHEDYRKIYRATTAMSRYFPFAMSNEDADPATMQSYFTTIAHELAFARLLTALGGSIPDAYAQVLTQLAAAQELFRPVMYAADANSGAYTVTFTYRTNPSAEQNATVVYSKVLLQSPNGQEVGKLLFTPGEQATFQWRPGDQVGIEIRWAKDAGITPVSWIEGRYRLVDHRTASFRAGGTWSLFRLVADHQVEPSSGKLRLRFRVLTSAPINPSVMNDPTMVLYFDVDIVPAPSNGALHLPLLGALPAPR